MNTKIKVVRSACTGIFFFIVFSTVAASYEEINVNNGATIQGTVKFEGKFPKLPPLKITKSKELCRNIPNETLLVGPRQGIRYAVVTLEGITKGVVVEKRRFTNWIT